MGLFWVTYPLNRSRLTVSISIFKVSFWTQHTASIDSQISQIFCLIVNFGHYFELFSRHSNASSKAFCCVSNFSPYFFNNIQCFSEIVVAMRCFFKLNTSLTKCHAHLIFYVRADCTICS